MQGEVLFISTRSPVLLSKSLCIMLSPLALCFAKNYALCYRLWRFALQRIVHYALLKPPGEGTFLVAVTVAER